jgi:hypothetical protein
VASLALLARCFLQQGMIETTLLHKAHHPSMIVVAGYTVLAIQLLVKQGGREWLCDGLSCRQQTTDIGNFMAGSTTLGGDPFKGNVAGKTIGIQLLMTWNQFPWSNHQLRVDENQNRNHDQVGGKDCL